MIFLTYNIFFEFKLERITLKKKVVKVKIN